MVEAESHTPEEYQEKNDDRLARVYLVHHMHHFLRNGEIEHELHHCFLYTGKNKTGSRFEIVHEAENGTVHHCLAEEFVGLLYDHANNVFHIENRKIGEKESFEILF
ncbi:MAG TPA: hypothetical protein DCX32_04915 [Candidatus Moranbacteria bacterium]|nr:MAG: hypothetical protein UW87_C0009G0004 [Candidatus Moranbacteria bacterium GW2011_GWC2_45_10]KKT95084.1 MAG: hypothetical protein UW95_C0004G0002 [Parcubacteria group bacterium GW2011_GWC1_45_14]HAV11848.1 hypothetical protein [Candidatus Moranbacteria bacterium]